MASADPQRQQHAQGRRRASCILRAACGDPEPPARERRGAPRRRRDQTCCPRPEKSERASRRARVRAERVWGAPTPLRGRLFKFGEVGSAPSKGAWGFPVNSRRSGAEAAAAVAAELKF